MSSEKVLVTAAVHPYLHGRFRELGFEVNVREDISRKELLEIIPDYSILIITTYLVADQELIDKAIHLKIIGRVGSGMENVDQAYAKQKNIICLNSPEGNANAVGEHTLALLLNLLNKISSSSDELKNGTWKREENRGLELDGKTVGIIGFGHTGSAFAKKLSGFDVRILACDPYKKIEHAKVEQTDLSTVQSFCDVISFHVPYNKETHHYISTEFIKKCTRHPFILNTSRGAVADTLAVIDALEKNSIKGFGVDVYEDEPLTKNSIHSVEIYQKMLAFKNVIATPHIAGWTAESAYKLVKILMDKIEQNLTF